MSSNYQCEFCDKKFNYIKCYSKHINLHKIHDSDKNIYECNYCHKTYTLQQNLKRHMKKCERKDIVNLEEKFEKLQEQLQKHDQKIAIIEKDPKQINNQNILQVVCVGQKDNYLDMLTQQYDDFDRALEFIKDCALSSLSGDCKLIEKIYLNQGPQLNLYFVDKNRTKIEYYNENKELVRDTKELFGRKLANNLQNSYLKGVNHLINDNLENKRCPNKFLEDYDLQMWNQHIFDLSDVRYHKKIINQLNIPVKTN